MEKILVTEQTHFASDSLTGTPFPKHLALEKQTHAALKKTAKPSNVKCLRFHKPYYVSWFYFTMSPAEIYGTFCFLPAHPLLVSGEQRVNMAKAKVKQNYGQLEKEFQKQKAEMKSNDSSAKTDVPNIRIKEEPVGVEEPMDTHEGLNNGLVNGLHPAQGSMDPVNGHLPGGCIDRVAQELKAFVSSTFKKQFVLTLSELKRLFNLHLASLPPGHTLFSGISDKMLQDMVLDTGCKQILVPVSMVFPWCALGQGWRWGWGGQFNIWDVKYLCPVLMDQKDRCAQSTCLILDLLKLLEFCLAGSALCPVVLGAPFPHPRCCATVICCPSLLLLTWSKAGPGSHQFFWNCTSSFPWGQGPSWERRGDIDCLGAAGHTQQSLWKRQSPSAAGFLGLSVSS